MLYAHIPMLYTRYIPTFDTYTYGVPIEKKK